ncbi:MAG: hypothetical protein KAI66_03280 [Lentisphaeria bacterium]|nr:hypothetical protein [Lentisphaeria bacterium]
MNTLTKQFALSIFVLALCAGLASTPASAKGKSAKAVVRKIEIDTGVSTPEYNGASRQSSKGRWTRIEIEFETVGGSKGWISELEFEWNVLIADGGRFMRIKKTFSHLDVESGESHKAVVYIRPSFIKRWYNRKKISKGDIAVHVELKVGGERIGSYNQSKIRGLPKNWWEKSDKGNLKTFEDALLSREETPFQPLDYDRYGHIKPDKR